MPNKNNGDLMKFVNHGCEGKHSEMKFDRIKKFFFNQYSHFHIKLIMFSMLHRLTYYIQ